MVKALAVGGSMALTVGHWTGCNLLLMLHHSLSVGGMSLGRNTSV